MKIITLKMGPTLRQYVTVISADMAFLLFAMHMSWLSPLLIQLNDKEQKILPEMITAYQAAWLISISNLVGVVALYFPAYLMDLIGRKYTVIIGLIPRLINCLMFLIATDVRMMLFGRAVGGLADVLCCSVTATYVSEIASKEIRGSLGTLAQIMSAFGSMLILCIGPFLDYMNLTILVSCLSAISFLPSLFLPESPYFLYAKGRVKESADILALLRNKDAIEEELKEYELNLSTKQNVNKLALLKDGAVIKSLMKTFFLAIGSQMTGFNSIMFYLQTVLESTHTTLRSEISSAIIGCIQVVACCVTILITDRLGRKPLLTCTLIGLAIGMIGLGIFFKLRDLNYEIVGFLNYLPLISLILVIFCFNAGIGSIMWTLCAELFEGPSRAMGVSLAVGMAFVFTFLTTRYFGSVLQAIGPSATYWMYGGCCVIFVFFIIIFIPETKGKSFSEIQRDLRHDNTVIDKSETCDNSLKA